MAPLAGARSIHDFADLSATVPLGDGIKQRVHDMLRGTDRHYHGVGHVTLLWQRHCSYARKAGFRAPRQHRLIACAILFHDCIYDTGRGDNEERSAKFWMEASEAAASDIEDRIWVADTIRATRDHLAYEASGDAWAVADSSCGSEALRLWMLDLDLSPFGERPEVFDRNVALLRAEAPHLDDTAFETARLALLRRFADAAVIFRTPVLAARFDAPARANLARHLAEASSRDESRR